MTGYSGSISGANDAWLKDLIRSREAARGVRPQKEAMYSGASTVPLDTPLKQPVSISRTMRDFCVNTLNYIGEHPVEFALSVGTAMAVRWGVTAGLIALGSGVIGGLALSIAAAMITSVVLGVGKAALKGESLSAGETGKKALFSGLIAGVLGAFLGGMIPPPQIAETPDFLPEGAKITDRYAWEVSAADWGDFQAYTQAQGEDLNLIPYNYNPDIADTSNNLIGENTSLLLASDKEWFVFELGNGDYHAVHRDALQEMLAFTKRQALAEGLPAPEYVLLRGNSYTNAVSDTTVGHLYPTRGITCEYDLVFFTESLTQDKDIYEALLYHELGHVDHNCNHYHSKDLSLHEKEYEADDFMLKLDNYGGYMENFSRIAAEDSTEWDKRTTHPSTKDRLLRGIELAAKDTTLDLKEKILFEARLKECQGILDKAKLPGTPDLLDLWKKALGVAAGHYR